VLARAPDVDPRAQLAMEAALQRFVDGAISKTIRVDVGVSLDVFSRIFDEAYEAGIKGCTAFCPNPVTGLVLGEDEPGCATPACTMEREAD
jgi:ribonucleoside-diphosphate reductase alpha chain